MAETSHKRRASNHSSNNETCTEGSLTIYNTTCCMFKSVVGRWATTRSPSYQHPYLQTYLANQPTTHTSNQPSTQPAMQATSHPTKHTPNPHGPPPLLPTHEANQLQISPTSPTAPHHCNSDWRLPHPRQHDLWQPARRLCLRSQLTMPTQTASANRLHLLCKAGGKPATLHVPSST